MRKTFLLGIFGIGEGGTDLHTHGVLARGGGGNSYMEQTGMLVGNFEFNP